ncbi:ABC transporter ATP-binding protein [Sneathiella sp. CAU 1612]|uniref:ABC transporter ATP-binding protein n=1 Tax=Sneathiella sedimenti TaxID=2816034 RepID=A0ABS3F695_9PROT|nr:ABC transporter ATP-binding protein [Sneathiella sedimenti]
MLEIKDLDVGYGTTKICRSITLNVDDGELVCLLGRNGVGKTTLLRGIIGMLPATNGNITFNGVDITTAADYDRARAGIGYVPQGRLVFQKMTVLENLRSGTMIGGDSLGSYPDEVFSYFPVLKQRLNQAAGTLSGGEQQMLALARVLSGKPKLLLLDEPSEGIQPSIVAEIAEILKRIKRERGLALLLVEQNLKFARSISERGYVIEKGGIVAAGTIDDLAEDDVVREHLTFAT